MHPADSLPLLCTAPCPSLVYPDLHSPSRILKPAPLMGDPWDCLTAVAQPLASEGSTNIRFHQEAGREAERWPNLGSCLIPFGANVCHLDYHPPTWSPSWTQWNSPSPFLTTSHHHLPTLVPYFGFLWAYDLWKQQASWEGRAFWKLKSLGNTFEICRRVQQRSLSQAAAICMPMWLLAFLLETGLQLDILAFGFCGKANVNPMPDTQRIGQSGWYSSLLPRAPDTFFHLQEDVCKSCNVGRLR